MKKSYNLLMVLMLFLPGIVFSQTVTIGAGALVGALSSNAGVIYRSTAASTFDYSHQYYLYTQSELAAVGIVPGSSITAIAWNKDVAFGTDPANTVSDWKIYMKNSSATPSTTWSSNNFATQSAGATLVYSSASQVIPLSTGWITLNLTTPIVYTGGSLEVGSIWDCSLYAGNPTTGGFAFVGDNLTNQVFGSSAGSSAVTMTLQTRRPQIQLTYVPGAPCSGMPTGGSTTASSNPVCPSTAFSVGLSGASAASGLTYQWQNSTNGGASYSNISGATNPGYSATQTANTYYQCIITCTASGMSATSTPILVNTNSFANCYCTSNATSVADEEILNVTIGSLNNSSSCPGIVAGYANYTASVAAPVLAASANYPFSVNVGTCGTTAYSNITKIWIDYNQNGVFTDPGEDVYTSAVVTGAQLLTGNILIPASAIGGLTRMRVVTMETSNAALVVPCGTYSWGETEDYLVNIAPIPTCPQPTALTLVTANNTSSTISWTAGGSETQWQVEYGIQGFTQGTGTVIPATGSPTASISGLTSNSFYCAYVRGICGAGDSSYWAGTVCWNTYNQGQYMEWSNECPTVGFVNIAATGTDLNLTDDGEAGIALPFPVLMQGVLYTNITIGNNGGVQLGSLTAQIGYGGNFNTMASGTLFPWGDDLDDETGNVYWQVNGAAPNRILIVHWDNICNFSGSITAPTVNFQLQIHEATNEIFYVYDDVVFGAPNAADDYGGNADIGLSGPNQDFTISTNDQAYLTNNSCVRFSYSNCPKPTALVFNTISPTGVGMSWTAGLAGESNWTVIYGPQGFDPALSGTITTVTSSVFSTSGLTQLTAYDVYVYADCSPIIQSQGLFGTFTTPPFCSNITGLAGTTAPDSLLTTWNFTPSGPLYSASGFNIAYGNLGTGLYSGNMTFVNANNNFSDTTYNASLLPGAYYDVYVQAVCGTDTSTYIGPITLLTPLTNDNPCNAELLATDGTVYTLSNQGATMATGEQAIAPPATGNMMTNGWGENTLNFTTWFTFVAPPSGNLRIDGTNTTFNNQMAVYKSVDCANFASFLIQGANDDAIAGNSLAPNWVICGLTPGNTYYLMNDSYSTTATGTYSIKMTEVDPNAGVGGPLINACSGDLIDVSTAISGQDSTGVWYQGTPTLGFNSPIFNTGGLAYQTFNFSYVVSEGCAADSSLAQVKIYPPSSAGQNGTITVCRHQPFSLLTGLSGVVDLGGTWYSPTNVALANSYVTAGNIAGQFNYKYIAGNGVCPNDTSIVLVIVQPCDFLDIEELDFEAITLFPNPTSGVFTISNKADGVSFNYEVIDSKGRVILTSISEISSSSSQNVDLTSFENGMYMIRLFNEKATKMYRIVKN